jgi:hypothetical protein
MKKQKTQKAVKTEWREKVLIALNLEYSIIGKNIIFKGDLGNYETLVNLLVSEAIKLSIKTY